MQPVLPAHTISIFQRPTDDCFGPTAVFGHTLLNRIIPRQEFVDPALFVAVDDGCERAGHVGLRIDSVEFAGLNERGDGRPVFYSGIVACKECILPIMQIFA